MPDTPISSSEKRIALYARGQDAGNQLVVLRDWAHAHRARPLMDEFVDNAAPCPSFEEFRDWATKHGGYDTLVVARLDRLPRTHVLGHIAALSRAGVRIVAVADRFDTAGIPGALFELVLDLADRLQDDDPPAAELCCRHCELLARAAEGAWHLCRSLLAVREGATDGLIEGVASKLREALDAREEGNT